MCLLGIALMAACNPETIQKRDFATEVLRSEKGRKIRGIELGKTMEAARQLETAELVSSSDSSLVFREDVSYRGRKVELELHYNFDQYGLFEVQIDVFPASMSDAEKCFLALKRKLTLMYGSPKPMGQGWRYTTFSLTNNIVEVSLHNESRDAGKPFVSINFLEPLDDEL